MIVHEVKNNVSTVRFHDEFCECNSQNVIGSAARVVSNSYKRRYLSESKPCVNASEISAIKPANSALQP